MYLIESKWHSKTRFFIALSLQELEYCFWQLLVFSSYKYNVACIEYLSLPLLFPGGFWSSRVLDVKINTQSITSFRQMVKMKKVWICQGERRRWQKYPSKLLLREHIELCMYCHSHLLSWRVPIILELTQFPPCYLIACIVSPCLSWTDSSVPHQSETLGHWSRVQALPWGGQPQCCRTEEQDKCDWLRNHKNAAAFTWPSDDQVYSVLVCDSNPNDLMPAYSWAWFALKLGSTGSCR